MLPEPGQTVDILIPGEAGAIEAQLSRPRVEPRGLALVCHPHPLMGGAMSNKVTYMLASIASKAGLYALRFNFRGVGKSEGRHDEGRAESDDVVFLAEWLRREIGGLPLLLGGFSFGAYVSLRASARVRPQLQVSVAPPFARYVANEPPPQRPPCPWLVVHSRDDEIVPYEATIAILEKYQPPPEIVTVQGAGHFFHGRLTDLQELVLPFIEQHLGAV